VAKSLTITAPDALFDQAVAAVCGQYGYQAKVPDPAHPGQTMANPQSPVDFAKLQVVAWIGENINAWGGKQIDQSVQSQKEQLQQSVKDAAGQIQTTIQ
jgi:hypothetical protein